MSKHEALTAVYRLIDENTHLQKDLRAADKDKAGLILRIKKLEIEERKHNERLAYHLEVQMELEEKRKQAVKNQHRLQMQLNAERLKKQREVAKNPNLLTLITPHAGTEAVTGE